jgi:hypothetical protein
MSTVVVSDGGGSTGSGMDWGGTAKVLAVIAGLGIAAYFILPKLQDFLSGLMGSSYGGGGSLLSGSNNPVLPSAQGTNVGSARIPAGTYIDNRTGAVNQGTGLGNLFVNTGQGTPNNFFPGGAIVATSRPLSTQEQQQVINNLLNGQASQGITNAWWQPQTLTQTTQPGGINAGGSPQSNIPIGTKHCPCTDALRKSGVCRPNDDWYYC